MKTRKNDYPRLSWALGGKPKYPEYSCIFERGKWAKSLGTKLEILNFI